MGNPAWVHVVGFIFLTACFGWFCYCRGCKDTEVSLGVAGEEFSKKYAHLKDTEAG